LFDEREKRLPSELPGVLEAEPVPVPVAELQAGFDRLERAIMRHDKDEVRRLLFTLLGQVTGQNPETVPVDDMTHLAIVPIPHGANGAAVPLIAIGGRP
jgi:O-antigen biosynthesis protein WbqV